MLKFTIKIRCSNVKVLLHLEHCILNVLKLLVPKNEKSNERFFQSDLFVKIMLNIDILKCSYVLPHMKKIES